jgi:hypothetical protein
MGDQRTKTEVELVRVPDIVGIKKSYPIPFRNIPAIVSSLGRPAVYLVPNDLIANITILGAATEEPLGHLGRLVPTCIVNDDNLKRRESLPQA